MIERFKFDPSTKEFSMEDEVRVKRYEMKADRATNRMDKHLNRGINSRGFGGWLAKPWHKWRSNVQARKVDRYNERANDIRKETGKDEKVDLK